MKIAIDELRGKVITTFVEKGFSQADADEIADYLLWAEMSGNSTQGILKMTGTEFFFLILSRLNETTNGCLQINIGIIKKISVIFYLLHWS